ncbi:4-alpha-glucanotransferase [Rhizomicrobium palustre]|uniref:4-alpha-glucanotransferase n=1 Tax=Rhizomicrobium palustre TaxID=189966 RepID=A0A846MZ02_9PROT|nr:4-alpha-glucanotransferase [Rhizomicrobium palustre]NIK88455.1 4-alpha-glucanotransferase [Rhizomicrobium palustre]
MDAKEVLLKLAAEAGIEDHYWDMHGERHDTTLETIRGLLKAFHIPAETDEEALASLNAFWREPWMRLLPPVLVLQEGAPALIPLRAWEEDGQKSINWQLVLEDGEPSGGVARLGDLPHDDIAYFDGKRVFQHRLKLDALPPGYHRFSADGFTTRLIVAPARCYLPEKLKTQRVWGLMLQLYSLKSKADWGVGDFADLKKLSDTVAEAGGDAIGLNPLHTLFLNTPENASPYSPASRLFRNPLYLAIPEMADFAECEPAQTRAASADYRAALEKSLHEELVDYKTVAALKLPVLELLYQSFVSQHLEKNDARAQAFNAYIRDKGRDLEGLCTFQVLVEKLGTQNWLEWPQELRDRDEPALTAFRSEASARIGFYQYLQWQSELQFAEAANHAREQGMAVGLYNDLAVSVDASSADHWNNQALFATGARVGAPPDPFNEKGQDWGVVPLNPLRLRETGYDYFTALLRSNMRHAGALRIDHVMGLTRLYIVPPGGKPSDGAYVRYPLTDLLAITALESQRNKCLVIGEDLGTVPAGFRERLQESAILSSRVLYFERSHDTFKEPAEYPGLAAVSVSTHDLATLSGFWVGDDLAAKDRLGLFKDAKEQDFATKIRAGDKEQLLAALAKHKLLPKSVDPEAASDFAWSPELTSAVHRYMASAPSALFMVQMDDFLGQVHQANLPGSITEYPNWRRRLERPLEELLAEPDLKAAMAAITKARQPL